MKREIMKKKLSDLQCEIGKIKDDVDDYTREYLSKMEKIIEEYKNKWENDIYIQTKWMNQMEGH